VSASAARALLQRNEQVEDDYLARRPVSLEPGGVRRQDVADAVDRVADRRDLRGEDGPVNHGGQSPGPPG